MFVEVVNDVLMNELWFVSLSAMLCVAFSFVLFERCVLCWWWHRRNSTGRVATETRTIFFCWLTAVSPFVAVVRKRVKHTQPCERERERESDLMKGDA
jgi:hypothetical protein